MEQNLDKKRCFEHILDQSQQNDMKQIEPVFLQARFATLRDLKCVLFCVTCKPTHTRLVS